MLMFQSNADFFMRFFERCTQEKLETEEERLVVLLEMARESGECSVVSTKRTREEIVKDAARHGKVLDIKAKT